jgi:hypothetical protein
MPPSTVPTSHRVDLSRTRQLISDSQALMALAHALIGESRRSMARQRYLRIVCAWCKVTMRFERSTVTARGQISHSICFACFADVFQELAPSPPLPLCSPKLL